ncbi:MAG TPA: YceI family protein [Chthoniobacteraceae bacterium]|jgi:polyisoprenoid-binding protein YceI|nr:YceI family protein [Chthoniobacteraceae bacterium]
MSTISRVALSEQLAGSHPPILIDVCPGEYFKAGHIRGAKNCCVYEVAFLDQIAHCVPDKSASVVVYGSSTHSLASATAQEKLTRAGYPHALDYRGGLEDWQAAGLSIDSEAPLPAPPKPRDGRHAVDIAKSRVQWTGRNIDGAHNGAIALQSGWIEVTGDRATGQFIVDMNSIANTDLGDSTLNGLLVAHLKGDDFFDTAQYPTATFDLRHVTLNHRAHPGSVNSDIDGSLTLKGVTESIGFPALIEARDGGALSAEAHFDINRTRWNVIYGSGKFYERLGQHIVHDIISLSLHIVTD